MESRILLTCVYRFPDHGAKQKADLETLPIPMLADYGARVALQCCPTLRANVAHHSCLREAPGNVRSRGRAGWHSCRSLKT